jgi:hypothetical protein
MNNYFCEYKILPNQETRSVCMTLFGEMNKNDDIREQGDVKVLGRWSTVGEARGFCIAQAEDVASCKNG